MQADVAPVDDVMFPSPWPPRPFPRLAERVRAGSWFRARCAKMLSEQEVMPHKCPLLLERREPEFEAKWAEVLWSMAK